MNDADAERSVLLQVPGFGAFVRALLPVQLEQAHTVTYGVWVGVTPDDLQHAFRVWREPAYSELEMTGRLANAVPPNVRVGAVVRLVVRDPDQIPYCETSPDPDLQMLLTRTWRTVDGDPAVPIR